MRSKSLLHTLRHAKIDNAGLAFSPSGQFLYAATAEPEAVVRRLDLETWQAQTVFREAAQEALSKELGSTINALAMSPDGRTLAINVAGGTILFDVESETPSLAIPDPAGGGEAKVAFSPDGDLLAIGDEDVALWYHTAAIKRAVYPTNTVTAMAFCPRRRLLVTVGEGLEGQPSRVDLWDVHEGKHLAAFRCHTNVVLGLAFIPGTEKIMTGSIDGTLAVWNLGRFAQGIPKWQRKQVAK
jgi:WD40 repeat protein